MRRLVDPEVQMLAAIAGTVREDYAEGFIEWEGSPFAWIKTRPSRQVGKIGEQLVAGWCAAKKLNVIRGTDTECDRLIEDRRVEIKFSTLWKAGGYKFQQIRDQRYDLVVCLGISPFDAHCWVIPKDILLQHVIGVTPQHGGRSGSDTAWIHVRDPNSPPAWMQGRGGSLGEAFAVLSDLLLRGA